MAESTLSAQWSSLRESVGRFLDYGTEPSNWSAQQEADVERILVAGLRDFYFPPGNLNPGGHEWSFMEPTLTITTVIPAEVTAGQTITATTGTSELTLSAELADLLYNASITLDPTGNAEVVTVAAIDGVTVTIFETLENAYAADAFNYTNPPQEDYDAPDNFGSISGPLVFRRHDGMYHTIKGRGEGEIRSMRQQPTSGAPIYFAIRPREFDGTTGQRFSFMLWPTPDIVYTLEATYQVLPDALTIAAPYPLGGASFANLLELSCLRKAEHFFNDEVGVHSAEFEKALVGAVLRDERMSTPKCFGQNLDHSDGPRAVSIAQSKHYMNGDLLF